MKTMKEIEEIFQPAQEQSDVSLERLLSQRRDVRVFSG